MGIVPLVRCATAVLHTVPYKRNSSTVPNELPRFRAVGLQQVDGRFDGPLAAVALGALLRSAKGLNGKVTWCASAVALAMRVCLLCDQRKVGQSCNCRKQNLSH